MQSDESGVVRPGLPQPSDGRDSDRAVARPGIRVACLFLAAELACSCPAAGEDVLNGHAIRLDASNKLVSWVTPQDQAYSTVCRRAWDFLFGTVPVEKNGLKSYYSYCCLNLKTMRGTAWPHNPACVNAGLTDGAAVWYAYSGDRRAVDLVKDLLVYQLEHGTTPANWLWGGVPYASASHGDIEYRGAFEFQYSREHLGIGDGYGVVEPDKVGELGVGYLKMWKLTGELRFRDAAIACANALAKNVREGDWGRSPWPFRVYAETGRVREEYSSNVIGSIRLLDELTRLGQGDAAAYGKARQTAWNWMMAFPMRNMAWSAYFEDVVIQDKPYNLNQYSPMETARYLMEHPETDAAWKQHVQSLIGFVERTFVVDIPNEPAVQWGANTVSEQFIDTNKMGSHTSRYASVNALWAELTGDAEAKEKAYRSFNWASYMCRDNGFVHVGPVDQSLWFSDGYADYIKHFLAGMGAQPEWAPQGENHILRSTSIVPTANYGASRVAYTTFDKAGTEVLRLAFTPRSVTADGAKLARTEDRNEAGWSFDSKLQVLRIRRLNATSVLVE